MEKLTKKTVNAETGEETIEELTKDEIAEVMKGRKEAEAYLAQIAAKEAAQLTICEKIGITLEEAKILLS